MQKSECVTAATFPNIPSHANTLPVVLAHLTVIPVLELVVLLNGWRSGSLFGRTFRFSFL